MMRAAMKTTVAKVKPELISFNPLHVSDTTTSSHLNHAADLIRTNQVVAFPTETVYGLGGNALSDDAVKAIYAAKNRPADNPLIVHVALVEQLQRKLLPPDYSIPNCYKELLAKYWPGPLTILLPVLPGCPVSTLVTAGQPTFAVRVPSHPVARALIALSDTPIAAPSANASTRPLPTRASHVVHDLDGRIPLVIDGGSCGVGLELTVVDGLVDPPQLLRPGGVLLEQVQQYWPSVIVAKKTAGKTEAVRTPGMKYKHYSPTAKVWLTQDYDKAKQYVQQHTDLKVAVLSTQTFQEIQGAANYAMGTTPEAISHSLFALLRQMDDEGMDEVIVEAIDKSNGGLAVMNRLEKAAVGYL